MKIILDENIPTDVKDEIKNFHETSTLDVDDEYKGILDFDLVDEMDDEDIMVTRDKELHANLLNRDKKSVFYDIETDNLVEVQVKLTYYLKGYGSEEIHSSTDENEHIHEGSDSQLRRRFEELKKENSRLKSRVNVLEGKLKSVLNTAESAFEDT